MRKPARTAARLPDPEAVGRFVEEAGLVFAALGIPPMAGRIVGWLLACAPPEQTQAQLAAVLQASKGSISTMVQVLLRVGMVRRVKKSGDRREYVEIPADAVAEMMSDSVRKTTTMRRLAESGLDALDGAGPEQRRRLEEMRDLYGFFEREMPAMFDRWRREQARARKRT